MWPRAGICRRCCCRRHILKVHHEASHAKGANYHVAMCYAGLHKNTLVATKYIAMNK